MIKDTGITKNRKVMDTLIGAGTTMEKKLISEASIRIEGTVNVDIECAEDIVVGESGKIKANISSKDVIIAGSVQGNVIARGKLQIMPSGKLEGTIHTPSLIIMEGGSFLGTSSMSKNIPTLVPQREIELKGTPVRNEKAEAAGS